VRNSKCCRDGVKAFFTSVSPDCRSNCICSNFGLVSVIECINLDGTVLER